jgi:hypothetical protein
MDNSKTKIKLAIFCSGNQFAGTHGELAALARCQVLPKRTGN